MHLNKFDQEATKHVETPEWKLIEMHLMKTKHRWSSFGPMMILKESIIIVCGFNLMAWKDSLAHTTGGDAKNK